MRPDELENISRTLTGKAQGWQTALASYLSEAYGGHYSPRRVSDWYCGRISVPRGVSAFLRGRLNVQIQLPNRTKEIAK